MSIDGDALPDFNGFDVTAVSHSAGGFLATPWAAVEPIVSRLYINATGGGMMRSLNGGHFGPDFVQPFLSAFAGIEPGTPDFEAYLIAAQTLLDSADSINWGAEAAMKLPIIHNQVMQDGTVPNIVPGAPLAGSEALNRIMGLNGYSTTQADPEGLSGVARFVQPADHESLFRPDFPQVTAEMQGEMASFIVSGGTFVNVGNPDLLVPIPAQPAESDKTVTTKSEGKPAKGKNRAKLIKRDKGMRGQ
jgi:pimeloyl-ACP methyl ester carboxylesterase